MECSIFTWMHRLTILLLSFAFAIEASGQQSPETDPRQLAQRVIDSMGGSANYNAIRYLGWNYFGYRQLIWDHEHNRVRVDYLKKKLTIITELDSDTGKLFMNGSEVTDPDSLAKYMHKGKVIWMNDLYWLAMPFKLLDPGVELKYIGWDSTLDHKNAIVLEMTFHAVGETPQNKYHIYIDPGTFFIIQWNYFDSYTDVEPEIINTWGDYRKYGSLYFAVDRGTEGRISDIYLWEQLPESVFTNLIIPPFTDL